MGKNGVGEDRMNDARESGLIIQPVWGFGVSADSVRISDFGFQISG